MLAYDIHVKLTRDFPLYRFTMRPHLHEKNSFMILTFVTRFFFIVTLKRHFSSYHIPLEFSSLFFNYIDTSDSDSSLVSKAKKPGAS